VAYEGLPAAGQFTELLTQADEFVRQTHSYEDCSAYARAQVRQGHGINVTLVQQHMAMLKDKGFEATCAHVQEQHKDGFLQPQVVETMFREFPEYD
jgi:hypothetical protein